LNEYQGTRDESTVWKGKKKEKKEKKKKKKRKRNFEERIVFVRMLGMRAKLKCAL
jgi:hypothetical protein